jgi:hypothetical protein
MLSSARNRAMLITNDYELIYNEIKKIYYLCINEARLYCPHCGQEVIYRDSRLRIWRHCNEPADRILIHRMFCRTCNRLHTVLPDVLVPHKHYGAAEIETILESEVRIDEVSDSTAAHWRQWIRGNEAQIEGVLQSLKLEAGDKLPELRSTENLFIQLKKTVRKWLSVVSRLVVNGGFEFLPVLQCCHT